MIAADRIPGRRLNPVIVAWIGAAWAASAVAQGTGNGSVLNHGKLVERFIEGGPGGWATLALFLLAWQVMLVAMMIPSSLPLITLFFHAASAQPAPRRVKAAFLLGYAAVWSVFGILAFIGDIAVHLVVGQWGWLAGRPWLISGGVLVAAGTFQFSSLKDKCLQECRNPAAYMLRHYRRRGWRAALRMGAGHGMFCLGCCWALMLIIFSVGAVNLLWMAPLTAVMALEKTGRLHQRGTAGVGVALIALGVLTALYAASVT